MLLTDKKKEKKKGRHCGIILYSQILHMIRLTQQINTSTLGENLRRI